MKLNLRGHSRLPRRRPWQRRCVGPLRFGCWWGEAGGSWPIWSCSLTVLCSRRHTFWWGKTRVRFTAKLPHNLHASGTVTSLLIAVTGQECSSPELLESLMHIISLCHLIRAATKIKRQTLTSLVCWLSLSPIRRLGKQTERHNTTPSLRLDIPLRFKCDSDNFSQPKVETSKLRLKEQIITPNKTLPGYQTDGVWSQMSPRTDLSDGVAE